MSSHAASCWAIAAAQSCWPRAVGPAFALAARPLAIAEHPQIARRVHLVLWHLADRWGSVEEEHGVFLPLKLSRVALADLVCSTRESVSGWAPSQGSSQWEGVSYGGVYILRIRTCTEHEGCSAWKKVS